VPELERAGAETLVVGARDISIPEKLDGGALGSLKASTLPMPGTGSPRTSLLMPSAASFLAMSATSALGETSKEIRRSPASRPFSSAIVKRPVLLAR